MKFFLSKISIFILFLFLIFHFSFFISPAFAQAKNESTHSTSSGQANYPAPNTNPDVPNNLHNWTQNVMIEVMSALTCQLAGVDPTNPKQSCLGIDSTSGKIGFLPAGNLEKGEVGGAIGGMNNMISMLYNPPIHTSDYFQNLAQNFGVVKATHAQTGTGFEGLKPLLNLWTAFRNIVYLLFVIVFAVIGLAIMLRIKIDPRTVMTIQNQIPKIIIGILLVTFSFAIGGFLVDLMWVTIYLLFGLISDISPEIAKSVATLNPASLQESSPFGALGADKIFPIIGNASAGIGEFLGSLLKGKEFTAGMTIIGAIIGGLMGSFVPGIGNLVGGFLGGVLTGGLLGIFGSQVIGDIGTGIAFLIILIAVLIALFRLWFTLLMAYINILIDVVLAPFWIVGSLVPGSPVSAVGWLRDLIANLAAFPTVIAMFLLGSVFVDAFESNTKGQFVPPLIGNPADTDAIGGIIGLGIILMTPNVVNMIKAALKAPKLDTGLGRAIGAGVALPVNVGKNIGGSLIGSQEAVMRKGPTGTYDWGERGIPRTIFGRFFGR